MDILRIVLSSLCLPQCIIDKYCKVFQICPLETFFDVSKVVFHHVYSYNFSLHACHRNSESSNITSSILTKIYECLKSQIIFILSILLWRTSTYKYSRGIKDNSFHILSYCWYFPTTILLYGCWHILIITFYAD